MKKFKYIFTLVIIAVCAQFTFAQNTGELRRFSDESLTVKNEVKLYPNPSVDYLEVRINNSTLTNATFTVHNIIGNVVEAEIETVGEGQYRIKVENLAPGYYLLAIRDDGNFFKETYKFLKK